MFSLYRVFPKINSSVILRQKIRISPHLKINCTNEFGSTRRKNLIYSFIPPMNTGAKTLWSLDIEP